MPRLPERRRQAYTDPAAIKANLIAQLTAPVRWTYIVRNMLSDGVTEFTELGPGNVLQGLIKKVDAEAAAESRSSWNRNRRCKTKSFA